MRRVRPRARASPRATRRAEIARLERRSDECLYARLAAVTKSVFASVYPIRSSRNFAASSRFSASYSAASARSSRKRRETPTVRAARDELPLGQGRSARPERHRDSAKHRMPGWNRGPAIRFRNPSSSLRSSKWVTSRLVRESRAKVAKRIGTRPLTSFALWISRVHGRHKETVENVSSTDDPLDVAAMPREERARLARELALQHPELAERIMGIRAVE